MTTMQSKSNKKVADFFWKKYFFLLSSICPSTFLPLPWFTTCLLADDFFLASFCIYECILLSLLLLLAFRCVNKSPEGMSYYWHLLLSMQDVLNIEWWKKNQKKKKKIQAHIEYYETDSREREKETDATVESTWRTRKYQNVHTYIHIHMCLYNRYLLHVAHTHCRSLLRFSLTLLLRQ